MTVLEGRNIMWQRKKNCCIQTCYVNKWKLMIQTDKSDLACNSLYDVHSFNWHSESP